MRAIERKVFLCYVMQLIKREIIEGNTFYTMRRGELESFITIRGEERKRSHEAMRGSYEVRKHNVNYKFFLSFLTTLCI